MFRPARVVRSTGLTATAATSRWTCELAGAASGDETAGSSSGPPRPSARERLLDATVSLIRAKGAASSGTKEILDLADAPRGSFYFHFPEGKDQLVIEALDRAATATLASLVESLADDGDLAAQVRSVFAAIETELLAENYAPSPQ